MRDDEIRNEYARGSMGVALIVNKMRENKLRCYEREKFEAIRMVMETNAEGSRG